MDISSTLSGDIAVHRAGSQLKMSNEYLKTFHLKLPRGTSGLVDENIDMVEWMVGCQKKFASL